MRSIMLVPLTVLCIGSFLSEGSNSSWISPPTNESDVQGSFSSTSQGNRNDSLLNYNKGQTYSNSQSHLYPVTRSGYYKSYNYVPPVLHPTASYFSNQRGDKSVYGGSGAVGSGRLGDNYVPPSGYTYTSRFSKAYQEPLRSRYGSYNYNFPQNLRSTYVYGGSFQKGSSGYSYPVQTGQVSRGSRIYEEPNRAQFNIPTRTKSTGVYIIPTPSKLYYDGMKN